MALAPRTSSSLLEGFPYAVVVDGEGAEVHIVSAHERFRGEGGEVYYDCYDPDWTKLASRIGDPLLERVFGYGFPAHTVGPTATARLAWINEAGVTDRIAPVALLTVRTVVRARIQDDEEEEDEYDEDEDEDDEEEEFLFEVHGVCVDEAERGKGLGSALMRSLDRILGETRPVQVELHVDDATPTTDVLCRWYTERFGFAMRRRLSREVALVLGKECCGGACA